MRLPDPIDLDSVSHDNVRRLEGRLSVHEYESLTPVYTEYNVRSYLRRSTFTNAEALEDVFFHRFHVELLWNFLTHIPEALVVPLASRSAGTEVVAAHARSECANGLPRHYAGGQHTALGENSKDLPQHVRTAERDQAAPRDHASRGPPQCAQSPTACSAGTTRSPWAALISTRPGGRRSPWASGEWMP